MSSAPPTENLKPVRAVFRQITGRDISPATQNRLRLSGNLEMWFVLGVWCTTPEHVSAFIQRQTDKRRRVSEPMAPVATERSPATQRSLEKSGLLRPGS